jgi:hypothetical protein
MRLISRHTHLIVSVGSAALGLVVFAAFYPAGGESRSEGIGFTLGYLGLPSTIVASGLIALMPVSWDPHEYVGPVLCTLCYLIQWQFVAWLIYRRAVRTGLIDRSEGKR